MRKITYLLNYGYSIIGCRRLKTLVCGRVKAYPHNATNRAKDEGISRRLRIFGAPYCALKDFHRGDVFTLKASLANHIGMLSLDTFQSRG